MTILATQTTATIDVAGIVDDALVEGDETIVVTLTGTDNPSITVAAGPNNAATVNVLDNNAAEVSIAATTDADEAGPVDGQFTVTQTAASGSDTVVTYTVAGSATAGGVDYATLSGSVTVPAGDLTATIDVTGIVTDDLVEGTETVSVTLTGTDDVSVTVIVSPNDTASIDRPGQQHGRGLDCRNHRWQRGGPRRRRVHGDAERGQRERHGIELYRDRHRYERTSTTRHSAVASRYLPVGDRSHHRTRTR